MTTSRYAALSRDQLARLVPELLLIGQLIDRAGMPWVLSHFDRDTMNAIAIEEWMAASPIYTRRMQRALNYEGDDVITIFKGLQLDVGAPPQFMDFRFRVDDPQHGEFWLDHCGALIDVGPMGVDYVRGMCHDIEDPTFDATAVATNAKAQMRPIHRPPRVPADRTPHCAWTVIIDDAHPPVSESDGCVELQSMRVATVELDPIDPTDEGVADYSGPLLSDIDFTAFSHSALVRIADEVCIQIQLLQVAFDRAVRLVADAPTAEEIIGRQLIGITGVSGKRLAEALAITDPAQLIPLLPMLNPAALVSVDGLEFEFGDLRGWGSLDREWWQRAISAGVHTLEGRPEPSEVAVVGFSKGADWEFEGRTSLPIFPL